MKLEFLSATFTKFGLAGSLLALLIQTSPQAIGEMNGSLNSSVYELTGHVRFPRRYSAGTLEDGSGAVVWLVPAQTGRMVRLNSELLHYRMIQRHRRFEPHLLVVPAGSIVEFPHHDPWFHNGNVPPGKYFLHVWYENATPQALAALRRTILVGGDSRTLPTTSIVLPNGIPMTGKNVNSDQSTFVGANWGRP
jgi:hypothetical protein